MVIQKASINGINRRQNRVGDHMILNDTVGDNSDSDTNYSLVFQVNSIEDIEGEIDIDNVGDACVFSSESNVGKRLIQQHLELSGNNGSITKEDDPILIHFHDIPIFIVRAIPMQLKNKKKNAIYMSKVHCQNNKICEDTEYKVTCCSRPNHTKQENYPILSCVGIEVFSRYSNNNSTQQQTKVNAKDIQKALIQSTCHSVLSVNELKVITIVDGDSTMELVCRVAQVVLLLQNDNHSQDDASKVAMEEPYRGRMDMLQTDFYISSSTLEIMGNRMIPETGLPEDVIHVTTSVDMEWFPVRRIVLAPCIKLTKYVQAGRGKYSNKEITLKKEDRSPDAPDDDQRPHCRVNMDCCTFDRVLLFLLSLLYPKEYKFQLENEELHTMVHAASSLGLQPLTDLCQEKISSFETRVRKDRYIRFEEVQRRNLNKDELLLILDGMVLDITQWIEEHPGGPSIIPAQALNMDCTCFFEMYHVSRQSFLYLKSFYIGELCPNDFNQLERSNSASDGFLQSLRSYTNEWRVTIHEQDTIHKSL